MPPQTRARARCVPPETSPSPTTRTTESPAPMKESERDADFVAESPSEADEDDESGENKGEADSDLEQSCGSEEGDSFDADPETNLLQQARNAHSSNFHQSASLKALKSTLACPDAGPSQSSIQSSEMTFSNCVKRSLDSRIALCMVGGVRVVYSTT
ncbi:hypothetical protein B0H14DRAFT_2567641 [Mycena olivaceomarginata]|nr:hypothetical protein B0H14DRAFT_2567641 [Mycena olivaceomarginata]